MRAFVGIRLGLCIGVVVAALAVGGCAGKKRARVGQSCGSDSDCESGLCLEETCLDPLADDDGDGLINEREGTLGTNPLSADTDGDGVSDGDELLDTDGDGLIDALESNLPGADPDHDCLPDQVDAHNDTFDATCVSGEPPCVATLVTRFCLTLGVCGAQVERIVAQCNADLAGQVGAVVCDYAQVDGYEPTTETICDERDNNCDGATDEAMVAVADDNHSRCSRLGVCAAFSGVPVADCTGGTWTCNFADGLPDYQAGQETTCDGLDNDCDGQTDEDFTYEEAGATLALGAPCGFGACAGGAVQCSAAHDGLACSTAGNAGDERCNGLDDDCDGLTDEGFEIAGVSVGGRCQGTGACSETSGVLECRSATAADCSVNFGGSEWTGSAEVCDGATRIDNDCDGQTDEEPVLAAGAPPVCRQVGVCLGTSPVFCGAEGEPECDYAQIPLYEPAEQTCDELDNNCDGRVDETLTKHFYGAPVALAEGVPSDRTDYAVAFVPDLHRVVMFGGLTPPVDAGLTGSVVAGDTWELDTVTGQWLRGGLAGLTPPAREGARLLYDAAGERMLLVGGRTLTGGTQPTEAYLADLWTYDLATHTWADATPVGGFPQSAHRAIVLAARGGQTELWIVGGVARETGEHIFAYSYALGAVAGTYWDTASADFYDAAAAYDPDGDRIVVMDYLDHATGQNRATTYFVNLGGADGPTIEEAAVEVVGYMSPPQQAALSYAPAGATTSARMVLFTVQQPIAGDPVTAVWVLDLSDLARGWLAASFPAGSPQPSPRTEAAAAISPADGRLYVALGTDLGGFLARDAWSVNLETNRWRTEGATVAFPPPRVLASTALDGAGARFYVYGGAFNSKFGVRVRKDLWRFDLEARAWEAVTAEGALAVGTAMVYDSQRQRLIGIGGLAVNADGVIDGVTPVDSFWTFDVATRLWSFGSLSDAGAPGPRGGHTAVYDAESDSVLVFGGFVDSVPTNELWRLSLADDTWTQVTAQGATPIARAGHFAALDGGKMVVFGGTYLATMDVFDVATQTWLAPTELPGTAGLAMLGVFDPFSREAVLVLTPDCGGPEGVSTCRKSALIQGTASAVVVQLAAPGTPVVTPYPELSAPDGPAAFLMAPAAYDVVQRGALVLAGPSSGAGPGGGLWRLPQVCPGAEAQ